MSNIEFQTRISHSIWMLDLVWIFELFDIRFECWIRVWYSIFDLNVGLSLIFDIRHSIWMYDLVWYSIFDIQNLNVRLSLMFDVRHSIWMLDLEYDIRYSTFEFEFWISSLILRYSTFDLNVGYRISNSIQHSNRLSNIKLYSTFEIKFECIRISSLIFDIRTFEFECWI